MPFPCDSALKIINNRGFSELERLLQKIDSGVNMTNTQ
jgi:hypothetical protein